MAKNPTSAIEALRRKGYEPVTTEVVIQAYEILLGMSEAELNALQEDTKQPMALRALAEAVAGKSKTAALVKVLEQKREEKPEGKRLTIYGQIEKMKAQGAERESVQKIAKLK